MSRDKHWDSGIVSAPPHDKGVAYEVIPQRPTETRRKIFPSAFEHDIPLPDDMLGGPVLGIDGQVVGITIAKTRQAGHLALTAEEVLFVIDKLKPRRFD